MTDFKGCGFDISIYGPVVKLAYTVVLGATGAIHGGSSPLGTTTFQKEYYG